jgi:MFS transporter, DHA2 family, multidrug resistance protein
MWHQQHLQQDMVPGSIGFQQHLNALSGFLGGQFGGPNGGGMAMASIYNQLNQQAQMQGYQDVYMELCYMSIALIALAFLLSKNRPGEGGGSGAMH